MPITRDIPRAERAAALERFRRGELHALVSARVLNEGTDVPDADVAIIVGGTQGEREHVQRIPTGWWTPSRVRTSCGMPT
jgi:superfamily II DNA or RNA helicase